MKRRARGPHGGIDQRSAAGRWLRHESDDHRESEAAA